jgi:hypothetical protein
MIGVCGKVSSANRETRRERARGPLSWLDSIKEPSHCMLDAAMTTALQDIPRHKTAIGRSTLSRPVKLALADGLIDPETPLFDYGCGRGDDLRILSVMGYSGSGWDPVHRSDPPSRRLPSSISATSSMSLRTRPSVGRRYAGPGSLPSECSLSVPA